MSTGKVVKIADLTPNVREISFFAKVLELGEIRDITKRDTGEEHKVCDVLIGDETGVVLFSAWNEHIDEIEEGEIYFFNNVKTILFHNHIRVSLGRMGTIEHSEEEIETINRENNVSEKEYERPRYRRDYRNYRSGRRGGYRRTYEQRRS